MKFFNLKWYCVCYLDVLGFWVDVIFEGKENLIWGIEFVFNNSLRSVWVCLWEMKRYMYVYKFIVCGILSEFENVEVDIIYLF